MTRDELFNEIKVADCETVVDALRAVVELHKPTRFSGELVCDACEEWTNEGASQLAYPCPTIQAIEKELK